MPDRIMLYPRDDECPMAVDVAVCSVAPPKSIMALMAAKRDTPTVMLLIVNTTPCRMTANPNGRLEFGIVVMGRRAAFMTLALLAARTLSMVLVMIMSD